MKRIQPFEGSVWIAPPSEATVAVIKRTFTTPRPSHKATIHVTGLGFFEAYLNGKILTEDRLIPAPSDYFRRDFSSTTYSVHDSFTHRIYYHTFDITDFLVDGENELKIILGGGWFVQNERIAEGKMSYSDRPRCIYEIDLGDELISSDGSEIATECEIRTSELFIGEVIDYTFDCVEERSVLVLPSPDSILTPSDAAPDRVIRRIKPAFVGEVNGKRVYDAGENISGLVSLVTRAPHGAKYTLTFAEFLNADGSLNYKSSFDMAEICASGKPQMMTDVFISDGKRNTFMPKFTWHAFRYFDITGDFSFIEEIEVSVIHSDTPKTAEFESDSEGLNFLFDAYVRTQLSNFHGSFPSDCPHRERLGYTGDGQICAQTAMMLLDAKRLYKKWIRDIMDGQDTASGHVQHTAPFQGGGGGPCGWGGAIITVPYAYLKQYGDPSILAEALPAMRRYIDFISTRMEQGLVVRENEGGWCLGDWKFLDSGKLPEPFVNTCWFLHELRLYNEMSRGGDARTQKLEELCLSALTREYQKLSDVGTANAYAAFVGIDTADSAAEYYEKLGHFDTGFLGTDILTDILFASGRGEVAYKLLSSREIGSFLNMKDKGATTLFESWRCSGSGSHPMFGACTRSIFEGILGIRQASDSYGYEKISFSPFLPAEMSFARGSILTPRGRITVELKRNGEIVEATINTPHAVTLIEK